MKRLPSWLSYPVLAIKRLRLWMFNKPVPPTPYWRPGFHYTPASGWMNDPNGLLFTNGLYHLFFQYIPEKTERSAFLFQPGAIHWGYSQSVDLLHWSAETIALSPHAGRVPFSGSSVLPDPSQPQEIALIYSECQLLAGSLPVNQVQNLARCDLRSGNAVCIPHPGNPVLKSAGRNVQFRDPKVFRFEPGINQPAFWVMALAGGRLVRFYRSGNLAEWTELASCHIPLRDGQFVECPELLRVPVEGAEGHSWVLLYSIGSLPGTAYTETAYLCGDFDGSGFTPHAPVTPRPIDHGPDFYAAQSCNDPPGKHKKPVIAAWMNNWKYAERVPTHPWRGQLSIPREISLRKNGDTYFLCQQPITSLDACRYPTPFFSVDNIHIEGGQHGLLIPAAPELLDIRLQLDMRNANIFSIRLRQYEKEWVAITYDRQREVLLLDRAHNTCPELPGALRTVHQASCPNDNGKIKWRILLDRSSVEIFGGTDGSFACSAQIFPNPEARDIEISCSVGQALLQRIEIFELAPTLFHPEH